MWSRCVQSTADRCILPLHAHTTTIIDTSSPAASIIHSTTRAANHINYTDAAVLVQTPRSLQPSCTQRWAVARPAPAEEPRVNVLTAMREWSCTTSQTLPLLPLPSWLSKLPLRSSHRTCQKGSSSACTEPSYALARPGQHGSPLLPQATMRVHHRSRELAVRRRAVHPAGQGPETMPCRQLGQSDAASEHKAHRIKRVQQGDAARGLAS